MASFGRSVSAVALRIYTPASDDHTVITLKGDWTIDSTSRADLLNQPQDSGDQVQPNGGGNGFALTGLMEWQSGQFDKRAFWVQQGVADGDPPDMKRGLVKVSHSVIR